MKRTLLATLIILAATQTHAGIINGSFETGLTNWSSVGSTGFTSITQTDGANSATVEALDGGPVNAASVSSFVGASISNLQAIKSGSTNFYNGAAIQQVFTSNAGDSLSFDWLFATQESVPSEYDFAFFVLDGVAQSLADTNLNTAAYTYTNWAGVTGFENQTDWTNLSMALAAGTHTLSFGVLQAADEYVASYLFIDNVKVTGSTVSNVPEPATLSLLGLGLLGLGLARRRAA